SLSTLSNSIKLRACLARDVDREGRIELRQHAALVACMVGAQDEDAELELVAVCGQALHVEPATADERHAAGHRLGRGAAVGVVDVDQLDAEAAAEVLAH